MLRPAALRGSPFGGFFAGRLAVEAPLRPVEGGGNASLLGGGRPCTLISQL